MAVIVLRSVKGSPLSISEVDSNFTNLNTEVGTKFNSADFIAENVLTLLSSYDTGTGSNLNATTVKSKQLVTASTADTIALRTSSGGLNATTFTGNLTGNVTGNVVGNVTGTLTGNATNVDGIITIEHGGTGASTDATARTNLGLGTIATQASSNISITGGSITGITDIAITDGGTGASNAVQARTNLGLVIGADIQPFSNELTAIAAAAATTGFYVRLGTGSVTERTFTVGGNGLTIANGAGIAGDPLISIPTSAAMQLASLNATTSLSTPSITKSGTNGAGDIGQTDNRFGIIYGTATSAKYADLAEKYTTDKEYEVGTIIVVSLDTSAEGTSSFEYAQRVLGVVSAKPAFLMNDESPGQALALRGRVPVKVAGPIKKGQSLVANQDGRGIAGDHPNSFAIALQTNLDPNVKLVECVIL